MKVIDLIPEWKEPLAVKEWGERCYPSMASAWDSYLNINTDPDQLVVLFRIIFPAFCVVNDCILLSMNASGFTEDDLKKFIRQADDDEKFEYNFNLLRIYELFSGSHHEESLAQVAKLIKRSWEISLLTAFPDKKFEVVLLYTDCDCEPILTFFTIRN